MFNLLVVRLPHRHLSQLCLPLPCLLRIALLQLLIKLVCLLLLLLLALLVFLLLSLLALMLLALWLVRYQTSGKFMQETNDAYIRADLVTAAR